MRVTGRFLPRFLLVSGQMSEVVLALVRNIILARLLLPDQFGIAISLSVVFATAELAADTGFDRSAVRGGAGDPELRRGTLHTLSLLRGLVIGAIVAACGPLLAHTFGAPEVGWAFALLGVGSVFRGFLNLGIKEVARQYEFWVDAVATGILQLSWTLMVVAFWLVFDDFRAMLYGLLAGQFLYVAASHLLSPYRWRLRFDRTIAAEVLKYGAPLVPNGITLAAKNLGDRLVVGAYFGLSVVGLYNVVMMTALLPRGIIQRLLNSVFMSYFVNQGVDGAREARLYEAYAYVLSFITMGYVVGFSLFGQPVIGLVFGAEYVPDRLLVDLVAAAMVLKMMMSFCIPPALAFGQTRLVLATSVGGILSLAFAALGAELLGTLPALLVGIAAGEAVIVPAIIVLTARRFGLRKSPYVLAFLLPAVATAAAGAAARWVQTTPYGLPADIAAYLALVVVMALLYVAALRHARLTVGDVRRLVFRARRPTAVAQEAEAGQVPAPEAAR
ncbi:oligosaccharide flippase family protein [Caenispirillum bisanense]|uniref:Polysaccharide transporter, PST family n=1 Tax=Caenispirillum bisanense TaxID=414052 RepID=A0A286GZ08_9PROT|nr:oligosaccharide flippase family protein [Caenispirillum bisanense]SOE00753.1 polysaccharide transporter, PST family [Caenispirillum bisanense]